MKKTSFISLLIGLFSTPIFSQIPVTDVAMNSNTISNQLINAATWTNQLNNIKAQASILDTSLKYVQNVSTAVRNIGYTKDILTRQITITKKCGDLITSSKCLSPKGISAVSRYLSSILVNNNNIISLVNSTLTSNFKMNDSERMQLLMSIKREQSDLLIDINKVNQIAILTSTLPYKK